MTRLKPLFTRGKQIHSAEGLGPLLKRGLAFVSSLVFQYQTYYLYKEPVDGLRLPNEGDVLPKVDDCTFRLVATNREADALEADGFEFRSQVLNAREKLDKGATAFCFFVAQELAHVGWVALTQAAKDSLDPLPYRVDFSNYEAYSGGLWTSPRYRRMGLRTYGKFKRLEFLQAQGIQTELAVIAKDNIASQKGRGLRDMLSIPGAHAEGRYLRVLWWKSWREKPLTPRQAERIAE